MTDTTFTCACCQGVFNKEGTDEEAAAELAAAYPGTTMDECDLVCDECYTALRREVGQHHGEKREE